MTEFRFIPVTPHPLLSPFVEKIHVFESSGRLPATERKLIVPNANFKLTLTYRNGMIARVGDKTFTQYENHLSLTGLIDTPVNLDPQQDVPTGTIIIEFNPLGAYRFFHLLYVEFQNQIVDLSDLIGSRAEELRSKLGDAYTIELKLETLQNFLVKQLEKASPDLIYDYCIERILQSNGSLTVARLEKETGYSSRWLHRKFTEHLGTGPKTLAEIIRFKQFYQAYSAGVSPQSLKEQIYQNYHDQSHFIRAFKRFTGSTPTDLQNSPNELANKHYKT
ncbi:MAG TPA: helix-turn-helix domain-containing protein [Mucilaginibacter sp.]|nr:helix-turn-helix domain-containing protein [Mucilaginibacter sp.]